ncbi:MAG: NAD(P)/FAD-dependent oxidoreductase [Campylobacterota bacterium]
MEKFTKNHEELIAEYLKSEGISRRDAMKMMGIGAGAAMVGGTNAQAATAAKASDAKGKIVIVGGGLAGVSTAAKLSGMLNSPDITIIEPNPESVSYQPGLTLVAAGVYEPGDVKYKTKDFMPDGVTWVQDKAMDIDGDAQKVKTAKNGDIDYDYLVVAAGITLDYGSIDGLNGEATTWGNTSEIESVIKGDNGVNSIYFENGAQNTWKSMQKFINDAKGGKQVKGVFTHPDTPIKCGGAPKKIMYLTEARLKEAGADARANAELTFYPNGGAMFGVPEYHDAIVDQYKARDMKWHYNHNLVAVDPAKKIATFDNWSMKNVYDEELGMEIEKKVSKKVDVEYDFLHVTPKMTAAKEIGASSVGSGAGWVPVTKETLQHKKYDNVFSLGDIAAVPMGKTGGSARKQYDVLCQNLVAHMEGSEMPAQYDGYTVCPLITGLGTVMLAEFDWSKKPTPSFPLDPTKERWIYWLLKVYMLKPMTQYGMLAGRA